MKRLVFGGILVIFSLIFINNLTSLKSVPKDNSIELNKEKWQNIDGVEMKESSSYFHFHLSWDNFVTHTIFLDKRIKALETGKTIPITDLYEEGIDDKVPTIPENNLLPLREAIYYFKESSGIYTSPDEEGYYNRIMTLEFTESFPAVIKRMFTNHYIYFATNSSPLIAYKINILPYDSISVITLSSFFIFGIFFYLMIDGINFLLGILLGALYVPLLSINNLISPLLAIIIEIFFIPVLIGFKLKIWDVDRKIFTLPVIIIGLVLYLLILGYFYFYEGDGSFKNFVEQSAISSIILVLFLGLFVLGYAIYDSIRLYRIIGLLLFGEKLIITDFEIRGAYMKTYHRGLPDYFMNIKINNQFVYSHVNCTRTAYARYIKNKEVKVKAFYFNKKGDMVIL